MWWTWETVNNALRLNDLSTFASRNFPRLTKKVTRTSTNSTTKESIMSTSSSKNEGRSEIINRIFKGDNYKKNGISIGSIVMVCVAGIGVCTIAISAASVMLYYYRNYRCNIMKYPTDYKGYGIVITGCDTGVGRATAIKMARSYSEIFIFAGCLTNEGKEELQCKKILTNLENLIAVSLDVTDNESVVDFVQAIRRKIGNDKLLALINNAGVYNGYFIELTPMDIFSDVIEVNYLGTLRITKALLPFLERSKGRIINMLSISALCGAPTTCAYTASKHAISALSDCLRSEVKALGIKVIKVLPGPIRTNSLKNIPKNYREISTKAHSKQLEKYGGQDLLKAYSNFLKSLYNMAESSDNIAKEISKVVFSKYPKDIYYLNNKFKWCYMALAMCPTYIHDFFFDVEATKHALLNTN